MSETDLSAPQFEHLYIGIDFGATYSKIAVYTPKARHPWHQLDIAPTVLCHRQFSHVLEFLPGAQSSEVRPREISCFKLLLMDLDEWASEVHDQCFQDHIESSLSRVSIPISATQLVSIYLRGLWKEYVELSHQSNLLVHLVLSWPASWENHPSNPLRKFKAAVELSGIADDVYDVTYVTEHEAAVHAVLHDYADELREIHEAGDPILVMDCGGLTIDGAIYCRSSQPQTRAECRITGGIALDIAFRRLITSKIRDVVGLEASQFDPQMRLVVDKIMDQWTENIKIDINLSSVLFPRTTFPIPNGEIHVTRDEYLSIFESVAVEIFKVILSLHDSAIFKPKLLFLTGGLSLNPHIQARVKFWLYSEMPHLGIKMVLSESKLGRTAVARGATLYKSQRTRD